MGTFRITSQYGLQREGFETAGQKHLGVDIGGPKQGEPVIAADGGVVIFAGTKGSYGQLVKIRHEDGVETYYAHMSKIVVEVGERVYQGQKIGEIGRTGTATGVHVHFEVRINGSTVNPVNYLPKLK
jgi:murein DD-endopeptidase MepM/ murein hydrolase activator NlpD